jgi:WD40 repeat protein
MFDDGSAVLDRQTGKRTALKPQGDVRHVAIHPDGSFVVSFGFSTAGFRVWKTGSGELIQVAGTDEDGCTGGLFTADGKHVLTNHLMRAQLQLWSMPDGKIVRELGVAAGAGISSDGRYVAAAEPNGRIRITRVDDGETMARFDAPSEESIESMVFDTRGRYLVGMNNDRKRYHVWDLWQIRRRLADMKLDWEAKPAPEPVEPRQPVHVEIVAP